MSLGYKHPHIKTGLCGPLSLNHWEGPACKMKETFIPGNQDFLRPELSSLFHRGWCKLFPPGNPGMGLAVWHTGSAGPPPHVRGHQGAHSWWSPFPAIGVVHTSSYSLTCSTRALHQPAQVDKAWKNPQKAGLGKAFASPASGVIGSLARALLHF